MNLVDMLLKEAIYAFHFVEVATVKKHIKVDLQKKEQKKSKVKLVKTAAAARNEGYLKALLFFLASNSIPTRNSCGGGGNRDAEQPDRV